MRAPDRVTTETFKAPVSQIQEMLARNNRPLKPHQAAGSKTRQMGDRKQPKTTAATTAAAIVKTTPAPNPAAVKHILSRA